MLPQYWIDFLDTNNLRDKACCLAESDDETGEGIDLSFFTEEKSIDEAINFWPGIAVTPDGYVPVARCLIGSGDPYFIKADEGPNGRLYRVYHDAVSESGYNAKDAIAVVLQHYEVLLKHVEPLPS